MTGNFNLRVDYKLCNEVVWLIIRGFKDGKEKLQKGVHTY
jgi:hypothetical protein